MKDISQKGYTTEEIWAVLRAESGSRQIRFRFDLLDENEVKKDELYEILDCSIEMDALANIKRTAKISLREEVNAETLENKVDWLKDRIQPFMEVKMPDRTEIITKKNYPTLADLGNKTLGEY